MSNATQGFYSLCSSPESPIFSLKQMLFPQFQAISPSLLSSG